MEKALNTVVNVTASGIPRLWEWGGMVTLLVLMLAVCIVVIFGLVWVIWQMYKNNQTLGEKYHTLANGVTLAMDKLTEFVKGLVR